MNQKAKQSRHHKVWTSEEERIIKETYGTMRRRFVAECLKRTVLAVSTRARQLGLTRRLQPWSQSADDILRNSYGKESIASIANRVGRTEVAVAGRASKLGLRTRSFWTPKDIQYLRKWYRKKSAVELAKLMSRDVFSVRAKAKRLELTKRVPKKPWLQADLDFFRDNIQTMSHRDLAQRLNRTEWAIGQIASRMGLLKKK